MRSLAWGTTVRSIILTGVDASVRPRHLSTPLHILIRCSSSTSTSAQFDGPMEQGKTVSEKLQVVFLHGLPTLTVPLPSRNEPCLFTMRPLTDTVGALCMGLKLEDNGIDYTAVYSRDGVRVSASTSVEHLLQMKMFRLRVNDIYFDVKVDSKHLDEKGSEENLTRLDELRETISALHAALCLDEYKRERETRLATALEQAERELTPLEEEKQRLVAECETHATRVLWSLFAAMAMQTGLFARLTWWEYSWDIMEPVTYFATYLTVVASAAYYLHTKQPFEYPNAKDRIFTRAFHKRAVAAGFDIETYLKLTTKVDRIREELRRVRDPLFHHLPVNTLREIEEKLLKY